MASGVRMEKLDVPGEQEFFFKGLCYSAISYAPLFIDKDAMVIGEGDLALRSTAELADVANLVQAVGLTEEDLGFRPGQEAGSKRKCQVLILDIRVNESKAEDYANSVLVETPDGEEIRSGRWMASS